MTISSLYENTATISGTEYSLTANSTALAEKTDDGCFQAFIDLNAMTATETYEIKIYEKTVSGGTKRLIEVWSFTGVQSRPIFVSPAFIFMHGWDVTCKKIAGTDRSIAWSIRQVA